jgi:hypothetical protein
MNHRVLYRSQNSREAWQRCRQGLSPDSSPKWDVVKWLRDYIPGNAL